MYCTNCGHKLSDGAKFCGNCGYPVDDDNAQPFIQPITGAQPEAAPTPQPAPQPEATPTSQPEAAPALQPEPTPAPQPQSAPASQSEAAGTTQSAPQPQPAPQAGNTNTGFTGGNTTGGPILSGSNADTILKIAAIIAAVVFGIFTIQGIGTLFSSIGQVFTSYSRVAAILTFLGNALNFVTAALMTAALLFFAFFRTDDNTENVYLTVGLAAGIRILAGIIRMILTYAARSVRHQSMTSAPFTTWLQLVIFVVIAAGILYLLLYASGKVLFIGKTKDELIEMFKNLPGFLTEELNVISRKANEAKEQHSSGTNAAGTVAMGAAGVAGAAGAAAGINPSVTNYTASSGTPPTKLKTNRNFFLYIVLSICTCGIYGIYFNYKMSKDLNTICEGDGSKTAGYLFRLVATICTCGIYEFYWEYSYADRMWKNQTRFGIQISETGSTILLWDIIGLLCCGLGPLVALFIQIKNLNALSRAYNIAVFGEP